MSSCLPLKGFTSQSADLENPIPRQLRNKKVDFIRVRKPVVGDKSSGKLPRDKGFQKTKNYKWGQRIVLPPPISITGEPVPPQPERDPIIKNWVGQGGNYGVLCRNGLIVVDIDDPERIEEMGKFQQLPSTFTVKTGGGGYHYYYWCPELEKKIIFHDPRFARFVKNKRAKKYQLKYNHLGEVQCGNVFVVGPGCLHHSGKRYTVVNDIEIATIPKCVIDEFIRGLRTEPVFKRKQVITTNSENARLRGKRVVSPSNTGGNLASKLPIPIERMVVPDRITRRDGSEMVGSNPWHGSRNGNNFHMDLSENVWHCFRCGSGGSWVEALAVELGVLDCSECQPGCLQGPKFKEFLEKAKPEIEKLGYSLPEFDSRNAKIEIITNRLKLDQLPDRLPENRCIILSAPPRIGKTHWAASLLVEKGGVYSAGRHSILKHVTSIYKKLGGKWGVWLEGKKRICREGHGRCDNCPLKPSTPQEHFKYLRTAKVVGGGERRKNGILPAPISRRTPTKVGWP